MRTASMVFAAVALMAAGTAVMAQTTCPSVTTSPCPPVVTQQICPPVTQEVATPPYSCPAGYSLPACVGAGPAIALADLCGTDFDRAYIARMYQLHTNVSALASQGAEQATDRNLRSLSLKIRQEKTDQNQVLATMYRDNGFGKIPVDYSPAQAVVDTLVPYTGTDFDVQYARAMTALLTQTRDAAQLAQTRSTIPRLRDQSKIAANAAQNEINALMRWVDQQCPAPAVCPPAAAPGCPVPTVPAGTGTSGTAPVCPPAVAPACPPATQ